MHTVVGGWVSLQIGAKRAKNVYALCIPILQLSFFHFACYRWWLGHYKNHPVIFPSQTHQCDQPGPRDALKGVPLRKEKQGAEKDVQGRIFGANQTSI